MLIYERIVQILQKNKIIWQVTSSGSNLLVALLSKQLVVVKTQMGLNEPHCQKAFMFLAA